jgi:hypothetical protein
MIAFSQSPSSATSGERKTPLSCKRKLLVISSYPHKPQTRTRRKVPWEHCPSPLHRHGQINMHFPQHQGKGDIFTLLGGRHFYFALTLENKSLTLLIGRSIVCSLYFYLGVICAKVRQLFAFSW